jgi:geranylgeranylglycerol-phosphate geranylgeranyltransferase
MNKYLQLFRLENGIIGIIGVIVSSLIAAGAGIGDHLFNIAISCVIVIFFIAGGNSINDYIDRDIDKVSHPERPIPSGSIEPRIALYLGVVSMLIACVLSFLLKDPLSISIVIIAAVLMISYEMFLKQRGFIGNFTIAVLTGMVFLFGGAIVGRMDACYIVAAMAFLVSVGREITKDIEDMEGDVGRKTLPMIIGKRNAGIVAAAFYIAGPLLSIEPMIAHTFGSLYYVVILADAMFIYAAIILFTSPHRSQKIAKVAMFVALVAFILGAIVVI